MQLRNTTYCSEELLSPAILTLVPVGIIVFNQARVVIEEKKNMTDTKIDRKWSHTHSHTQIPPTVVLANPSSSTLLTVIPDIILFNQARGGYRGGKKNVTQKLTENGHRERERERDLMRLCWQIQLPPHSLQRLLTVFSSLRREL